jgi:hypothetical protein
MVSRPLKNLPITPLDPAAQDFVNRCTEAHLMLSQAAHNFRGWLSGIAIAYSDAYRAHTRLLEQLGIQANIPGNILLGAALAFFPGIAGGVFGEFAKIAEKAAKDTFWQARLRNNLPAIAATMRNLELGAPTIDGVKDLIKWGMRSGAVVGMPTLTIPIQEVYKTFPTDPLSWQNSISERVEFEFANIADVIRSWVTAVNSRDKGFVPNFNPAEVIRDLLKSGIRVPAGIPPIDISSLTELTLDDKKELSRGFAAGFLVIWIRKYTYEAVKSAPIGWALSTKGAIINYGKSIGLQHIEAFMSESFFAAYFADPGRADYPPPELFGP